MPVEAASMPDPGDDLIARVVGGPDRTWFYWTGRESLRETERALGLAGRSLDSFQSILDFGCGCGRMLLWLEELGQRTKLHGTDVDPEAIEWARAHIPYCSFSVNDADPPLPYPDGAFDLVYNHSVFTHIDERRQDAWLAELRRVVRPGGFLILTTHGEQAVQHEEVRNALEPGARNAIENQGIVFFDQRYPADYALPSWYQVTYHAPWYVFEHWAKWFAIRAYLPGGALEIQDQVLLERTDEIWPRTPLKARPGAIQPARQRTPEVQAAARVRALRGAVGTSPKRFGAVGDMARCVLLRLIRPYTFHQDRVVDELAGTIETLAGTLDAHSERLIALERQRLGKP
jgi:SAM-dependent methyltransferase